MRMWCIIIIGVIIIIVSPHSEIEVTSRYDAFSNHIIVTFSCMRILVRIEIQVRMPFPIHLFDHCLHIFLLSGPLTVSAREVGVGGVSCYLKLRLVVRPADRLIALQYQIRVFSVSFFANGIHINVNVIGADHPHPYNMKHET